MPCWQARIRSRRAFQNCDAAVIASAYTVFSLSLDGCQSRTTRISSRHERRAAGRCRPCAMTGHSSSMTR